jgi:glycolate oxidase FAD binding subunit
LHPLPRNSRTLTVQVADAGAAKKLMLTIQGSRLAHTAMQARLGDTSFVDILLEGTEAGIAAQEATIRALAIVNEGAADVWNARQELWPPPQDFAIAKISTLPDRIARTFKSGVVQATGIGYARLNGDLKTLRAEVERDGGSLVILTKTTLDAWGSVGDTLPVMRALKQQLDPKGTLNPGRFAGGI